jgi:hypothetical protein
MTTNGGSNHKPNNNYNHETAIILWYFDCHIQDLTFGHWELHDDMWIIGSTLANWWIEAQLHQ